MIYAMSLDHEAELGAAVLLEREVSDEAALFRWANKPSAGDMVLGAGGSALVHLLIAGVVLLLPFLQAPLTSPEPYLTVNLVEMEGSKGDSCGTGSVEGASAGPLFDPSPPAAQQPEQTPPLIPPKPLKQVERVAAEAVKTVKKAPAPAAVRPAPAPVSPADPKEEPPSAIASASNAAAVAVETDARGIGEGAGGSASSGSSAGAGHNGGEFNADAVDKVPQAVQKVDPIYPQRARTQGVCGKVVLRFLVEPDGRVSRPAIVSADPAGFFEQSALDAIRHWRFNPGLYRGRAVATWVVLPVQFKLTS